MSTDFLPNEPTTSKPTQSVENSSTSPDSFDKELTIVKPKGSVPETAEEPTMKPVGPLGEMFPPTWSEASIPPQGPSPSEEPPSKPEQVMPMLREFPYDPGEEIPTQQAAAWGMQGSQQQPPAAWGMQGHQQQPPTAWGMQGSQQQPPTAWGMQGHQQQPPAAWGMQGSQQQPPVPPTPKQPGKLAHPLPFWALISSIALVVVFFIVLHLTGSDWAAGAANASLAALIIGIILVLVFGVRTRDGMSSSLNPTRRKQYLTSIICILVLFAYSGASQLLQPNLHVAQAHWLENRQNWQEAINEYTLGGEKAPEGEDLARTYTSWGLALHDAHLYNEAMGKFAIVISQFNNSTSTTIRQVSRAQQGDIRARIALGQQKMQAQDYASAVTVFDDVSRLSYCDVGCLAQINTLQATAYYNLGEASLQKQVYDAAVSAFDTVLTKFPNAPEAKQLHGDMAKALLGQGQQLRTTTCSSATPIYQRLAKEYNDTSDGKTAQTDLNAPQDVTGTFKNTTPATKYTQIGLVQGLKHGISNAEEFNMWDNTSYKSDIQNDGKFVIKAVRQGSYGLIWYGQDSTTRYLEFIYNKNTTLPTYVAQVGPLCSIDVGTVSNLA